MIELGRWIPGVDRLRDLNESREYRFSTATPSGVRLGLRSGGGLDTGRRVPEIEEIADKLTQRKLPVLGARPDGNYRYHAPSASTFRRVISWLDAAQFERLIGA